MQDEEFLHRLSATLRTGDDPGVEPIVARAREAAVREATAILEALMTRSILERAVDHLAVGDAGESAAPGTEPDEPPEWIWYVYGIQGADADPPAAVDGIVGAAVDGVEADGLRALVSRVRSADFRQPELVEHLDDLEWVGTNAHAHEAVLGAALVAGPVLPLRFGTVFRDREAVVDMLRDHAGELHEEVDSVAGRREWGAKVLVDLDACDRWIMENTAGVAAGADEEDGTGGRAYLARRQSQRGTRDERHRLLLEISSEVHDRLSDRAVDATTDPPQQRQLSGHEGEMILNGAYLVDDDGVERFQKAAAKLSGKHADKGIAVQITGPWPAHHFISLPALGDPGETA